MIGLIFATRMEARPFLEISAARLLDSHPFKVYQLALIPHMRVMISGMGKVSAALACQTLIRELGATYIFNAGACGALRDTPELSVCGLVRVASVLEGDHTLFGSHLPALNSAGRIDTALPAVRLVTSDHPVFDSEARRSFAPLGEVVDMEGAAIARTAALYGRPWDMIKGISDLAGPLDRNTLRQNLDIVSEKIARWLRDSQVCRYHDQENP